MGIPGILKEIGKGERMALSKLAIEHLERTNRPLRIAIDAAIWNFQNQASQGGKNPSLRTLFFKLLKLLALPIHPVFVYDGGNKPLTKRGKTVSRYRTCIENETARQLLSAFRYPHHTAPGEAEAECAFLQRKGIVDAVMSQDVDAIMFGSTLTLRDWSKEGTKGNKTPTHVNILDLTGIKRISGLDPDGMILVALLSGGDYDEAGVPGFGSALACEIARAGFGSDLLELVNTNDQEGLRDWRDRLEYELQTNESGYFRTKHLKLKIPEDFPNATILGYYMKPAVSTQDDLPELEKQWSKEWKAELDISALRKYTAYNFDWNWKSGARSFVRRIAQPLFQNRLLRGKIEPSSFSMDHITDIRQHFTSDGIEELRLTVVPAEAVEVDLEAEEENPAYTLGGASEELLGVEAVEEAEEDLPDSSRDQELLPPISPPKRQRPPWSPYDAEKWWIPQTLLQLGLPLIVEQWQQKQRGILEDPKKFATRKCPKVPKPSRVVDTSMKAGALRAFLTKQPSNESDVHVRPGMEAKRALKPPTKVSSRLVVEEASLSMPLYFQTRKVVGSPREKVTEATEGQDTRTASSRPEIGPSTHASYDHSKLAISFSDCHSLNQSANLDGASNDRSKFQAPDAKAEFTVSAYLTSHTVSSVRTPVTDIELQLPHVTQRKKRRQKPLQDKTAREFPLNPMHRLSSNPPILMPDNRPEQSDVLIQDGSSIASQQVMCERSLVDSESSLFSSRIIAVSRDSLPGAWKRAEFNSMRGKRGPRPSFIDLTGD